MPHRFLHSSPLSLCDTGYLLYIKLCIFSILLDCVSFIKEISPKRFVTLWAHTKQNQTLSWGLDYFILVKEPSFWMSLFLLFTNLGAVSLAIFFYRSLDNCSRSDWTLILFQENFLIQKQNHKDGLRAQVLNFKS